MNDQPSIAVVYTDEGPSGPCGQDCATTSYWTKVYLFYSENEARDWISSYHWPRRTKSRIRICYLDKTLGGYIQTLEYPIHETKTP